MTEIPIADLYACLVVFEICGDLGQVRICYTYTCHLWYLFQKKKKKKKKKKGTIHRQRKKTLITAAITGLLICMDVAAASWLDTYIRIPFFFFIVFAFDLTVCNSLLLHMKGSSCYFGCYIGLLV